MDNHVAELEVEQENFKRELDAYIARQIVKAFFGMMKAIIGKMHALKFKNLGAVTLLAERVYFLEQSKIGSKAS